MKLLLILSAVLLSSQTKASVDLGHCRLLVAGIGVNADADTVLFSKPKVHRGTGALEREATLFSIQATLVEAGDVTGINIYDTKKAVYFASEFKNSAMYATRDYTAQVICD